MSKRSSVLLGMAKRQQTFLDHVYLMGELDIEVKKHQPFYSDHCANLVTIFLEFSLYI